MTEYKVVYVTELNNDLKAVADSIRAKSGNGEPLDFPEGFCSAVESIETGNSAKEEQTKSLNVTTNGNYDILPDSGKVLSKASVNVNVPPKQEQKKTLNVTENGTYTVKPDSGKAISEATVNVSVPERYDEGYSEGYQASQDKIKTEHWVFELEDGTTVEKEVLIV